MRAIVGAALLFLGVGCARGIVHDFDASASTTVGPSSADGADGSIEGAAPPTASLSDEAGVDGSTSPPMPVSCEDTKTDDACFDCCDAKFPTGFDAWSNVIDACCPDDECTDAEYEKCEQAADDACAKDASCSGLDACEEVCWEKPSSGL